MERARALADAIAALPGFGVARHGSFFNEFVVRTPVPAKELAARLEKRGMLAGLPLQTFYPERTHELLVCATELTTQSEIADFSRALAEECKHAVAAV
jgi:glycine dehydrogenase subunit 1